MNLDQEKSRARGQSGLWNGPFVIAVVILSVAAVLAGPVNRKLQVSQIKKEIPLRSELATMSAAAVRPYTVVKRLVIDPAVVEALGTDRYINWILEDDAAPKDDPLRVATILITYYSGGHDLVPHVPDVCYLGAGYEPLQSENLELKVAALGADSPVPVRVLTFQKSSIHDHRRTNVLYTFHCNGQFTATRTGVRNLINDLTTVHAYFCKIEVGFPYADREKSIRGAERLLDGLLPALLRDHLPDFRAAEEQAKVVKQAT